jgi:cytochrome c-type biogenesis protein CcmH/NrfG
MCVANTNKDKSTIKTERFKEAIADYNTMLEVMSEKGERIPVELSLPALSFMIYELKK